MLSYLKYLLLYFTIISCNQVKVEAQEQELEYPNQSVEMDKANLGLITIIEFHTGAGAGDAGVPYSKNFSGFTALLGNKLNRNIFIAAGTGISFYNGGSLVPFFADLRYIYYIGRLAPYLFTDGGLLLNFKDFDSTKLFMNGGIGVNYSISRKFAVTLATGMLVQAGGSPMDVFVNMKTGVSYKF